MFARLLFESFRRQLRRKAFALVAIALGMSISTAMIAVATDIGDKIRKELGAYGANILITPIEDNMNVEVGGTSIKPATSGASIQESQLPAIKTIFWRHNILGFAPFLSGQTTLLAGGQPVSVELIGTYFSKPVQTGDEKFVTGVRSINKFWKVDGTWPPDKPGDEPDSVAAEVLAGISLAHRLNLKIGDTVAIGSEKARISGVLSTGGQEDDALIAPLPLAQRILERPGAAGSVLISALTKPEDAFARQNPNTMPPATRERWYCSPYANSIAFQLREAFPNARVEQIRQVEQNQGKVLSRISGLMLLLAIAAIAASVLAVSAIMAATIIERRQEVGLMKSLGAGNGPVALLFLTEAGLLAVVGGGIGFFLGAFLAQQIGQNVFGSSINVHPVVLAIVIFSALLVAFAGSITAIRKAMHFDPAVVLRGDA
ncbi:MAG TPA: FtsX-like permease family protein [Candidatus Angelobacter sp.]|nr:FtsX-like permease family protein [Candidatus Angelobacter sp.]